MQTYDNVWKKYIVLVEIDSMVLFFGMILTTRAGVGMLQQNYNAIREVNPRVKLTGDSFAIS